jgi:hypothetical protein
VLESRLDILANELTEVKLALAVSAEANRGLIHKIEVLEEKLDDMDEKVDDLSSMANRWKGGFIVLAGLGGVVGWILSTWESLRGLIK